MRLLKKWLNEKRGITSLKEVPLNAIKHKTIILRTDYNVPLSEGKIKDNSKIKASLATIRFFLEQRCKIVIITHFGRPEGRFVEEYSTKPLAEELEKLLPKGNDKKVVWLKDCIGEEVREKIRLGSGGEIYLLENLRFYPEEERNELSFARSLASLGDIYINDAFSVSHRENASVCAITQFLPSAGGLSLMKEIEQLKKILEPERPAVWVMGGGKLDKVKLLEKGLKKADKILLGGAIVFPFLRAKGFAVGNSKTDAGSIESAKIILKMKEAEKLVFPEDFKAAEQFSARAKSKIIAFNEFGTREMGLDLGPETVKKYKAYLRGARTIFWNGPLGYFEWPQFAEATREIAREMARLNAITICGGGETAEAVKKMKLEHRMTHVSLGGGATIAYLSGEEMPGLKALKENRNKFKP